MSDHRLRPPATAADTALTEERLAELRAILPEVFADGQINWETLRETLDPLLEDDRAGAEHFGLFWPGKREARRMAALPSHGALHPAVGEGVNEAAAHNIFIEGDNLEVLKLLLKSYAGRIKMIYIDPPYNTSNDFVYRDDYSEPLEAYLRATQQSTSEGKIVTTNPETTGRRHSNWLSMIYPRLILANALLEGDGVIYVSIDNNEAHNLRTVMNEIFGEENFLGCIVRATGTTTGQDSGGFGSSFDFVLAYSKSASYQLGGLPLSKADEARFSERDDVGQYSLLQLRKTGNADRREDRPSMYYPLEAPDGSVVFPVGPGGYESRWRCGLSTFRDMVSKNLIVWKVITRDGAERYTPYVKYYLEGREKRPSPLWTDLEGNKKATIEVKELLGEKVFDNPKPTALIVRLLQITTEPDTDDIVLDFFAGSCTTAHSVLKLNDADGGNRKFIMIQLPEPAPPNSTAAKSGFANVADLGKERIIRVLTQLSDKQRKSLMHAGTRPQVLGFRAYKLSPSDVRLWRDYEGEDIPTLEGLFASNERPLVDGWTPAAVLTEILLLQGFPLDSTLAHDQRLRANDVTHITSEACSHALYVCLDEQIANETIIAICDGTARLESSDVFVCLDGALTDEAKLRLADVCNLQTI